MKIIQLSGDMPPCCCGQRSSGGVCCGSQAKCKLTISAPRCSADGKVAETIAGPVDHWSWQVWMGPGDCKGEYSGSNSWDFVMNCIDGVYVMRMYQEQENGVVECQAVANSVQGNPLRATFTLSCDQCCVGASLSVSVKEMGSGVS